MKLAPGNIQKIGVFRALQLGDLLCSVPAFRALREAYPLARITLFGLPWAESFVKRFSAYFDRFVHFPGYEGLPEQPVKPGQADAFIRNIKDEHFDLIIQMQGNGTIVNDLLFSLEAKHTAGFYPAGDICPDNDLFMEYPQGIHEIERHLKLMQFLGIDDLKSDMEFPVNEQDHQDYLQLNLGLKPHEYVVVHPGSRGGWRQWPPACFAALADCCAARGLTVVLTGTEDESQIVAAVQQNMSHPAINLAGRTSVGAVGVLIRDAYALISNCTGVSHISAALGTRSIVISMDGEPERWGPMNKQLHYTIDWTRKPDFERVLRQTNDLLVAV